MEKKKFLNTDLEVSPICLGTVNYGTALGEKESKAQISSFLDKGGNFIDTAHIYGSWVEGKSSPSEKTLGSWFKETGRRSDVILATKGAHPDWSHMDIPRVHAKDITHDLEESLEHMNTDYIDLYFLHRDDPKVPVSEIIDCLDDQVKEGKIRYYGCSNWKLDRLKQAHDYAVKKGSKGFVCNQLMLSLADINFYNLPDKTFVLMDKETREYQKEVGINAMAYMSIAKGFFTRKLAGENLPESVTSVYENKTNTRIYEEAKKLVAKGKYDFINLSFLYILMQKDFPIVPIASFDNEAQLVSGLASWDMEIPQELRDLASYKNYVYMSESESK